MEARETIDSVKDKVDPCKDAHRHDPSLMLSVEADTIDNVKAKFFADTIENVKLGFCRLLADHADRVEAKFDVLCSKLEGLALGSAACAEAGDTIDSIKVDVWVDPHGQDPSHSGRGG